MTILVAVCLALGAGTAGSGRQAGVTVAITQFGFVPESVAIDGGDTVVWENRETVPHRIVADDGSFASPMLGPGQTFAHTFRAPGVYGYADGGFGKYRGQVTVAGAAATTLAAGRETVTFGSRVRLSGDVAGARAGEQVVIFAKRFGAASFARIAVTTTAVGGAWSHRARPVVSTTFRARAGGAWSGPVTVGVRPLVTFSARDGALSTSVSAARSLAGRFVVLQRRLAGGEWVAVKRIVLGDEGAEFRAQLPPGRSVLRIVLPQSQAGPGYLAGISRVRSVTT